MISRQPLNINKLFPLIIICTILQIYLTQSCTVTLHTHKLCSTSQNIIKIFDKISLTFSSQNTIKLNQIVQQQPEHVLQKDIPVYPMIIISKQGNQVMYQNQLSFVQLQYWITVRCVGMIPKCASWMQQPIFPISIAKPKHNQSQIQLYNKFVQFVIANPIIKICYDGTIQKSSSNSAPISTYEILSNLPYMISQLLTSIPVLMSINHNIRSHLLLHPQATLLMYIYYEKSQAQAMWKDKFIQFIGMLRKGDQRVGYQIKDKAKNNIVVVIDDINKKMVRQFLQFSQINISQLDLPAIVAFRFEKNEHSQQKQLIAVVYQQAKSSVNNAVLDAKFAHWLQQVALSSSNPAMSRKIFSMKNVFHQCSESISDKKYSLTHRFPIYNLKETLQYFRVLKFMQEVAISQDQADRYSKLLFQQVILLYDDALWQNKEKNQSKTFIQNLVKGVLMDNQYKNYVLSAQFQLHTQRVAYLANNEYRFKLCTVNQQQPALFHTFEEFISYLHSHSLIKDRPKQKIAKQYINVTNSNNKLQQDQL